MAWVSVKCPACGSGIEAQVDESDAGEPIFRTINYACACPLLGPDAVALLQEIVDAAREGWAMDFPHAPGYNEYLRRYAEEVEHRFDSLVAMPFNEYELRVLDRWRSTVAARDGLARVLRIVPSPDEAPGLVRLAQRGFVRMVESHGAVPVYQVMPPGLRWQEEVALDYLKRRG